LDGMRGDNQDTEALVSHQRPLRGRWGRLDDETGGTSRTRLDSQKSIPRRGRSGARAGHQVPDRAEIWDQDMPLRSSFGPPLSVLELNGSAEEWRVFATPLLRTEGLRTSGPALQVEWPRVHSLAGAGCHLTKIHMAGYRSRVTKRMCHVWAFKMGNH
jgi:hypothetical protein